MVYLFEETKIECKQLCSLIEVARKHQGAYKNTSIRIIVEDAIKYRRNPGCLPTLRRDVLEYSLVLGKSNIPQLQNMRPDALTDNELEILLNFFSNL